MKKSEKILSTKGEILAYCGISETSFKTYLSLGIPVRVIGGRYTSHKDNLDDFFRALTRRQDLNDSGQNENGIQSYTVSDTEGPVDIGLEPNKQPGMTPRFPRFKSTSV